MKAMFLTAMMTWVVACSGGQTSGGDEAGEKQLELKRQAASASSNAPGDVCADNDWYGDGACDVFCQDLDVDCSLKDVVCLAYIEEPNGSCDRQPGEPCVGQDPDCEGLSDPIDCTAIAREPDGTCQTDPEDPCVEHQDPDCAPSDPGTPTCKAVPEPTNGVCEREPGDPCLAADPDCAVDCTAISEVPDGVCSREPQDPCILQDPDCHVK